MGISSVSIKKLVNPWQNVGSLSLAAVTGPKLEHDLSNLTDTMDQL